MLSISRQGLFASMIGGGLAVALAFAPLGGPSDAQMVVPRGAVTPMGAPGQFSNSPMTTNAQGGQESVTVDSSGKLRAVGRSTFAPKGGVTMPKTHGSPRPWKYKNGTYVAPRPTLPAQP